MGTGEKSKLCLCPAGEDGGGDSLHPGKSTRKHYPPPQSASDRVQLQGRHDKSHCY